MGAVEEFDKMEDYERLAYQQGYDYAFGNESYGFGENNHEEDLKHMPECPDKEKWLAAWHFGCAVGVE